MMMRYENCCDKCKGTHGHRRQAAAAESDTETWSEGGRARDGGAKKIVVAVIIPTPLDYSDYII